MGVIPQALAGQEIAHPRLTQLHVVKSMHERKALMTELADAFVARAVEAGFIREQYRRLFLVSASVGALARHQPPPPIVLRPPPE